MMDHRLQPPVDRTPTDAAGSSSDVAPLRSSRRPYERPVLTRYGRVEDLTRSGGTTGLELKKLKKQ
jgi:hypothetical protein